MLVRGSIGTIATVAALCTTMAGALAFDDAKYPDWKGQWNRAPTGVAGQPQPPFDPSKPNVLGPMEVVIDPEVTYFLANDVHPYIRRVYTDGRDWPESFEPGLHGLAIGRWIDSDGDGRYDTLEIETRGFTGPRVYDDSGLPLHRDNRSIIKERLYLDRADRNVLHNEITVIDNALTRPWSVMKNFRRNPNARSVWLDLDCQEGQVWMQIGNENYYLSADGMLMPTRKGQAPPDLRYFQQR